MAKTKKKKYFAQGFSFISEPKLKNMRPMFLFKFSLRNLFVIDLLDWQNLLMGVKNMFFFTHKKVSKTNRHMDGHCNLDTESAQMVDEVKTKKKQPQKT